MENETAGDAGRATQANARTGQDQGNRRPNNNNTRGRASGNGTGNFRGETDKMRGFVFELPAKNSQLTETLDMLKRYVRLTYDSSPIMACLFSRKATNPKVTVPPKQPVPTGEPSTPNGDATLTEFDKEIFRDQVRSYRKEVRELKRDLVSLFSVVFGQCNPSLRAELRSQTKFAESELDGDCVWLLAEIRTAMTKFDRSLYVHQALHELRVRFYKEHQGGRSTVDYYNSFETNVRTLDENKAWALPPTDQDPDADVVGSTDEETQRNIRERELAAALILNADNKRFGGLKSDLKTNYARGTDQWPKTLTAAYNLLVMQERHESSRRIPRNTDPVPPPANTNTRGHQFAMMSNTKALTPPLPQGAILLDSGSSESIFRDESLLSDLRPGDPPLTLHTNGGARTAHQVGTYAGLGENITVWYDPPESLTNILALCEVRKVARVTMDTDEELALLVHPEQGETMRFTQHDNTGLYIYTPTGNNDVKLSVTAYSYLQTVAGNRSIFTRRELEGADAARKLYRQVGRPSPARFNDYLSKNLIRDCPITMADAKRAAFIYGSDIAYLKGKRTQKQALEHVPTFIPSPLPPFIEQHHKHITLCVDFFCPENPFSSFYFQETRIPHVHPDYQPLQRDHTTRHPQGDPDIPTARVGGCGRARRPRVRMRARRARHPTSTKHSCRATRTCRTRSLYLQ